MIEALAEYDDYVRSMSAADVANFWSSAVKSDGGCWLWVRSAIKASDVNVKSYPKLSVVINGKRKELLVSRISYALINGDCPRDKYVCHHCDNPPCFKPEHLFLGTQHENMADMVDKLRMQYGESHHATKVNEKLVRLIRLLATQGRSAESIATEFGLTQRAVTHLASGRTWKHVNTPTFVFGEARRIDHGSIGVIKSALNLGHTRSAIGRYYEVTPQSIYAIAVGKSYSNVLPCDQNDPRLAKLSHWIANDDPKLNPERDKYGRMLPGFRFGSTNKRVAS